VAVFADSAYPSKERTEQLQRLGIDNRIHEKGYRNKPLTNAQKQANRLRTTHRNVVERVFAQTKTNFGIGRMRYMGIARNLVRVMIAMICHNLKTARKFVAIDHPQSA